MSSEPLEYLRHFLVEANYLISHEDWLEIRGFRGRRDALACGCPESRNYRRGGEESSLGISRAVPDCRVAAMAGMRDRLIDDYFGVDYELVWDVFQNRIPEVRAQIVSILEA